MRHAAYFLSSPVRSLQTMLRHISDADVRVLPLIPDGYYGPNTYASVRSFQEVYGIPVTGTTDLETWQAIVDIHNMMLPERAAPVTQPEWFPGQSVRPGDFHIHLFLVQAMLAALSRYYPMLQPPVVSGTLDTDTEMGLKWVQHAAGLPETGILNTGTWHALNSIYRITTGNGKA